MKKGIFISFEGPDGSGKSTQISLLKQYCEEKGYEILTIREPGGTPISEKIREIILDNKNREMSPYAEALLFASSRAQLTEQVIIPALNEGKIVISDRFMDSSIAYQGFGRCLGDGVIAINEFAVQGIKPQLTFFMDIAPSEGKRRVLKGGAPDRLENEDMTFHNAVYRGYMKLAELYKDRYVMIDADRSIEAVAGDIRKVFDEYVSQRA